MKYSLILIIGSALMILCISACEKENPDPVLSPKSITLTERAPE